jgi:RNA polymerase sigma factor (TIGR02999 family)
MHDDSFEQHQHQLIEESYSELRTVAKKILSREKNASIGATGLLHEAIVQYIKAKQSSDGKSHYSNMIARIMRHILVDLARSKSTKKRDGCMLELREEDWVDSGNTIDLLILEDCLKELESISMRTAQIMELRYFGGFSTPEIAEILGIGESTVFLDLKKGRGWLHHRLLRKED